MGGLFSIPFVTCIIGVCPSHDLSTHLTIKLELHSGNPSTSIGQEAFLAYRPQTDALAAFSVQIQHCLGHLMDLKRLHCCQL